MPRPSASFDEQALLYDARTALPPAAGAAVVRAIAERAGDQPSDLVVELGAGTGDIGAHLAALSVIYLGLDRSRPMLDLFRGKVDSPAPSLLLADLDRTWPVREDAAAVVFASRAIHLLDLDHTVCEVRRVIRPGGHLILGRVIRDRNGVKDRLRRRRQELLAGAGIIARQGEEGTRRVVERVVAAGGVPLGRTIVAEWTGATTPGRVLADWQPLSRMGSVTIDPAMRAAILDQLRVWARAEFGSLDRPRPFSERYSIDVVRLP